jgi:hypothetical protein
MGRIHHVQTIAGTDEHGKLKSLLENASARAGVVFDSCFRGGNQMDIRYEAGKLDGAALKNIDEAISCLKDELPRAGFQLIM